jgi:hypothetical protein
MLGGKMNESEEIARLNSRIDILENKLQEERSWGKMNSWELIRLSKVVKRIDDQIVDYMSSDSSLFEPMKKLHDMIQDREPIGGIE